VSNRHDEVLGRAVAHWRSRGVALLPPASPFEIVQTFQSLEFPLSADVRALYTVVGGFAYRECDEPWLGCDGLWSLWSLKHIRDENERRQPLLTFADYMISLYSYAFHYEDADVSSVYIQDHNRRVAGSVAEFFERYLSDPESVEVSDL